MLSRIFYQLFIPGETLIIQTRKWCDLDSQFKCKKENGNINKMEQQEQGQI